MRILKSIALSATILALLSAAVMFYQVGRLARASRATLAATTDLVQDTHMRLAGAIQNTNAVLLQAGLAADEVRRTATEQRTLLRQQTTETIALLAHARTTVDSADSTVRELSESTGRITQAAVTSLDAIPPLLAETQRTMASVNALASDPALKSTLDNLNRTSNQVAASAEQIEKTTEDIRFKVHQVAHPSRASRAWGIATNGARVVFAGLTAF